MKLRLLWEDDEYAGLDDEDEFGVLDVRVTINHTLDWQSQDGDAQRGRMIITTPTGKIKGRWTCTGGRGNGAKLIENTSSEFRDDDVAHELLNSPQLVRGIGTYDGTITVNQYGIYELRDIVWHKDA